MKRIMDFTRRATWRFALRCAMAASMAAAFFFRYLSAPTALGEGTALGEAAGDATHKRTPAGIETQGNTPLSTQEGALLQIADNDDAALRAARAGQILARPTKVNQAARRGLLRLGLGTMRDGLLYVPAAYHVNRPAPLVLSLHGAGGDARQGLRLMQQHADRLGFILLAVESRRSTWDVLMGGYGPDVEFINRALARTFGQYAIDESRVAIAGFSDGASYALSVGITNGDLFKRIVAFSPGFTAPAAQRGKPPIFVSHGTRDKILPIDKCSRRIVPQLQHGGYAVRYREFDGPHTLPKDISREAADWLF
ncbi:MAG TPA: hypothetical protein VF600_13485 [Abditibacteriaceae bacterium]|jgi:predicted esterase